MKPLISAPRGRPVAIPPWLNERTDRDNILNTNYLLSPGKNQKKNYFTNITRSRVNEFVDRCGECFNILITGDRNNKDDFYAIPFAVLKPCLDDEYITQSKGRKAGWVVTIVTHQLMVTRTKQSLDVQQFFGNHPVLTSPGNSSAVLDQNTLVEDLNAINHETTVDPTTKKALVDARLGQGKFRTDVLQLWDDRCSVTGSTIKAAIRVSHIKPWRESSDAERLDPSNGLPLIASLDALFDAGLISFDSSGLMIVSPEMSAKERKVFGIERKSLRRRPTEGMAAYLAIHRRKHGFAEGEIGPVEERKGVGS
jgi:hypothetical protein